MVSWFVSGI